MKKISGKQILDTDADEILKKTTVGFYGNPEGYEETLYVSLTGIYYVYTNGGELSPYPKARITKISKTKAEEILNFRMA